MKRCSLFLVAVAAAAENPGAEQPARCLPTGQAVIRAQAGDSEIVITTTERLAGAIHSLTWNGKEFVDSFDHGRQIQSASNFDVGSHFTPETFNPTEAGSRRDDVGDASSSRLLHLLAAENALQTTTQMTFWLAPGEKSFGNPAKNQHVLSNHLLTKRVQIGFESLPHVIQYDVTFSIPIGERHTFVQFEAVTGYMPAEFAKFWKYNAQSHQFEPLSEGPGEQSWPVVLATDDGRYAMGVYSPDQPSPGFEQAGYGRFRFGAENVVKWNCVFRLRDSERGIAPGEYAFRNFVVVGDLETLRQSLSALHARFGR